jgi:pilus assembly protein CpaC
LHIVGKKWLFLTKKYQFISLLCVVFFALSAQPLFAQKVKNIELSVSEGITIPLSQPAQTIFIADPNIADIQAPSNTTIFMFGKKPGKTTLFALDENGNKILSQQITVFQPLDDVRKLLKTELGNDAVVLRPTPGGVVMSGTVANAEIAETAKTLVMQSLGAGTALINRIKIAGKMQVSLHVRVIEVSRTINKELNLNWSSLGDIGQVAIIGGNKLVNGPIGVGNENCCKNKTVLQTIDELATGGLISILAEPNLTAVSGESASFLAGGEFPIPVTQGQNGAVAIQYQSYGVSLDFVPTVLSDDLISIRVKPEVSELSPQTVASGNLVMPYISTRRAQTTVELGSGQSFAIGGLIRKTSSKSAAPAIGFAKVPFLGSMFNPSSHTANASRSDTELVIIVTPYIVRPAVSTKALQGPYVTERASIPVPVPPPQPMQAPRAPLPHPPTPRAMQPQISHEPACAKKQTTIWQLRDGPALQSKMPLGTNCPPAKSIATHKPVIMNQSTATGTISLPQATAPKSSVTTLRVDKETSVNALKEQGDNE